MEQIASNVFRLGSHGHNWYFLRDGDAVTVIDAGCSREWSTLTRALDALKLPLDAVAGFAITHSHADHFGLAKQATEHDLRVAVHADEESRARGTYTGRYAVTPAELPKTNLTAARNFLPMIVAGVLSMDHVDEVETFDDGETLDLPGNPVAIHTPGHTEGHTMFHVPEHGLLFTGDGLVTMDLLSGRTGPRMLDPRFHLDLPTALNSLQRLTDVDAAVLFPGHGNPWFGTPAEAAELARAAV